MEDVARAAGVSTMTVSRVLNNKGEIHQDTRQRILKIMDELDYRPSRVARSLATDHTFTLGVIVADITSPFFAEFVSGAEQVAWDSGYNVLLGHTQDDPARERAVLRLLEEAQVEGVLICSSRLDDDDLLPLLRRQRAAVMFNRTVPDDSAGLLQVDDVAGAVQAVDYLFQRGRQRVGFLAGPTTSWSTRARIQGFQRAVMAADQPGLRDWVVHCAPTPDGGYAAAWDLLARHPEIDGLFCYNDLVAVGALQACRERDRRVPDDIAVVGCDDVALARFVSPPLTTLRVDKRELGAMALRLLIERIQGHTAQEPVVVQQALVIRASAP